MYLQHPNTREIVVVLHGFGGSPKCMTLLCRRIVRSGRRAVNWGYLSWRWSIDFAADRLIDTINELNDDDTIDRIHFVGYSLGSIICRAALLKKADFGKLGRVVMLGPPNRGSRVASFFSPWVGRVVPTVRELATSRGSFVNGLPPLEGVQVGVIAGRRDRVVTIEKTHLECQREHLLVSGGHASLLVSREVAQMAMRFVELGTFASAEEFIPETTLAMSAISASALSPAMPLEQA